MQNFKFLDPENIANDINNFNKFYNYIQSISLFYNQTKDNKYKENIKAHISEIIEIGLKKIKKDNQPLNDLLSFLIEYKNNIDELDVILKQFITEDYQKSVSEFDKYLNSEEAFYKINSNNDLNLNNLDHDNINLISNLIKDTNISVKMEKIGCYYIFVQSGKGALEAKNNPTKQDIANSLNRKSIDQIQPSGRYDGEITINNNKTILFATSNSDTSNQNIFKAIKEGNLENDNIFFVFKSKFNPVYSAITSRYNNKKVSQHGKGFLKQLNCDLNENELENFNLLPLISMVNNIDISKNKDCDITKLLNVHPRPCGTNLDNNNTYLKWIELSKYNVKYKTEKFQKLLVNYLDSLTNNLDNLKDGYSLNKDTLDILHNVKNTINGVVHNFNKINLENKEGIPSENILNQLSNIINKYVSIVNRADHNLKNTNSIIDRNLFNLRTVRDLKKYLDKQNKNILIKEQKFRQNKKEKLKEKSIIKIDNILKSNFNFSESLRNKILTIIKKRHTNNKLIAFSSDSLPLDVYNFYIKSIDDDPLKGNKIFKEILNWIENNNNFNNQKSIEKLKNINNNKNISYFVQKRYQTGNNKMLHDIYCLFYKYSSVEYEINESFKKFISILEQAGDKGMTINELNEIPFFKTNITNKNYKNSCHKQAEIRKSSKTIAHDILYKNLGLYNIKEYPLKILDIKEAMKLNSNCISTVSNKNKRKNKL